MRWFTDSLLVACIILVITICTFCYSLGRMEGHTQGRLDRDRELDFYNHRAYELLLARQDP